MVQRALRAPDLLSRPRDLSHGRLEHALCLALDLADLVVLIGKYREGSHGADVLRSFWRES